MANEIKLQTGAIEKVLNQEEQQKRYRERIMERAIVEVAGKKYKANEKAQQRMERAIDYLTSIGQKTVEWITADGKETPRMPVAKLKEMYHAAMENQYKVFLKAQGGRLTPEDVKEVEEAYKKATGKDQGVEMAEPPTPEPPKPKEDKKKPAKKKKTAKKKAKK